jgi:hypothetical protein
VNILAIDPGNVESGYAVLRDGNEVVKAGVEPNHRLLTMLCVNAVLANADELAIEMMRARGMPVSNDEMETLVWIGRFQQVWHMPDDVLLLYRGDVKLHITGSAKAKDANVRAGLIELLGKPGTKKNPGPTYGVTSHAWPALAVAVYADHFLKSRRRVRL